MVSVECDILVQRVSFQQDICIDHNISINHNIGIAPIPTQMGVIMVNNSVLVSMHAFGAVPATSHKGLCRIDPMTGFGYINLKLLNLSIAHLFIRV